MAFEKIEKENTKNDEGFLVEGKNFKNKIELWEELRKYTAMKENEVNIPDNTVFSKENKESKNNDKRQKDINVPEIQ